jgi:hypothetical protein
MATGLANTPGLANPPTADHSGDRLIQSQLKRAGRYVKWVEAGSQLLTLLIATLIFFLAAALIDHWIISLGWFGRWLLCLSFVAGAGWFIATRLLPLLVRAVNPVYSARAIEEATPTLKNSLLNFLLLQKDHAGVKQSVMHALESRAASDISTVEVETAIDRAPLIRMGYILCGVMAFVAIYKIASPKDPFQTAARVVAPWADLARPSRVLIREVQPGHTSVYLGSQVEVTADVRGATGKDAVRLVYTSADGQVVDRALVMKNGSGNRYVATLPGPGSEQPMGRTGLQQGVQYHIEAGDAISSIYEIRVRMAPTIAVERAELTFPAYTLKQSQSQPTGEIKALEGTRVTIHARANQPIKSAFLELDPRPGRAVETIALQVDGQSATGGFTLQLKADRVTPWRESYQVRFTNEQGEISEQPVIHKLDVTPDLPPEVEILQPRLQKVDLAEDGRLTIEARGVDPDFALFDLHVVGKATAGELFRKTLLPPGTPQSQASGKFDFVPADYNLKAGTVVTYQAIAVDNRRDPLTNQPQPGRAATAEYTINIIPSRKRNPNEAPNPNAQQNQQPNDPQQQPKPGENKQPMKPGENPPNKPQQPMKPGEQQPPMPGENPMTENKPGENPQDKPQPNEQQPDNGNKNQPQPNKNKPQDKPNEGQQNNQQQNSGQSGEGQGGQSTKGSGNNAQHGSGSGQSNNNNQPNNNQPMPMPGENGGNSDNNPGNAQNQPSGNGSQPGGAQNQPGGENQPGGNPADPNQSGSESDPAGGNPNVREGAGGRSGGKPEHDGEKFEKLLEHLKKQRDEQKAKQEGGGQSTGQQSPNNSGQKPTPQKPDGQSGQLGKPNGEQSAQDKETSEQLLKELEKMVKEKQEKDAREGKTPGSEKPQDQTAENSQQPMPGQATEQQPNGTPMPGGQNNNSNNATGQKPPGGQQVGQPKPGGAKPGEQKPGQQGDPQNAAGPKPNEGGSPQGPPRNEPKPGETKPEAKPGEQKNPGAGENGNPREGGQQSKDPTGSAQGDQQAQDKPMQSQPGNQGGDQNANEASPPGQGKKNSDTKGATSGDQRGNGKQGPGQSGGAKGNDSAGKSSPGDEGAGRANEQGRGETGNKAGKGPEAAGKTGQPGGKQPGEGTETKAGEKGTESGKGGEKAKKPGEKGENEPGGSNSGGNQVGPGKPTGAGTAGDQSGKGITNKSADAADEANLEYTRRVTDLVLQSLRDQEHNPDPELAKRNGLSPQELQEFARRWSQLKKDAESDPAKARELDEALRSLGLRDPKNRRRSESSTDKQRDMRDAGGRTQAPSKYREQFDQFRKSTGSK